MHPSLLSSHPSHIFSLLHVCAFYLFQHCHMVVMRSMVYYKTLRHVERYLIEYLKTWYYIDRRFIKVVKT